MKMRFIAIMSWQLPVSPESCNALSFLSELSWYTDVDQQNCCGCNLRCPVVLHITSL
jgi:hypothetical protein